MDVLAVKQYLDESNEYHLARLLLILDAFTGSETRMKGITKLVKLDFLLRYPTYLEHALELRNASTRNLEIEDYERMSIESSMVRYRYGPWDARYRGWLNLLVARRLLEVTVVGRTVEMRITGSGALFAAELRQTDEFEKFDTRVRSLRTHLDLGATSLTKFIYDAFPVLSSMRLGEEIIS